MRLPASFIVLGLAVVAVAGCSARYVPIAIDVGRRTQADVLHPAERPPVASPPRLSIAPRLDTGDATPYVSPDADCGTGPLVYASQYYTNAIQIYKQFGTDQAPCATIQRGLVEPQGMAVDASKDVWVANTGSSTILAFKKGSVTPYLTLD